jgi:hypothetical protein
MKAEGHPALNNVCFLDIGTGTSFSDQVDDEVCPQGVDRRQSSTSSSPAT